jgi:hypothetical protein
MDNAKVYGLRFHKTLSGAQHPTPIVCPVATGYQGAVNGGGNVDLRPGDIVKQLSTGYVVLAEGSEESGGDADLMFGVIASVRPYWNGTKMTPGNALPGGTAWGTLEERRSEVLVIPMMPDIVWEIDADEATTAATLAAYRAFFGENCDFVNTNGITGKADPQLDISSHATTALSFRLWDVSPTRNNADFSGANVKLLVTANEVSLPWSTTTGT